MPKVKRLNRKIIHSNVSEAAEELKEMLKIFSSRKPIDEGELLVMFSHAYHHLNFAWNAKNTISARYSKLTNKDFNRWSKFPEDILIMEVKK